MISLDIRMLRSFVSVVQSGSITVTARQLGRTQPAITRSGTEMMNRGAPITGMDRRPLNKAGIDMGSNSFSVDPLFIPADGKPCVKDARHHTNKAIDVAQGPERSSFAP